MEEQTLTFGQRLVGLNFNPSADDKVGQVKQTFADMADLVVAIPKDNGDMDTYLKRIIREAALLKILDAQMEVVKLITLKY